jgi:hypothetical protein
MYFRAKKVWGTRKARGVACRGRMLPDTIGEVEFRVRCETRIASILFMRLRASVCSSVSRELVLR